MERQNKVVKELDRELVKALRACEEASDESAKLEKLCMEAGKKLGIPESRLETRRHEIGECIDADRFYKQVFETQESAYDSKGKASEGGSSHKRMQVRRCG